MSLVLTSNNHRSSSTSVDILRSITYSNEITDRSIINNAVMSVEADEADEVDEADVIQKRLSFMMWVLVVSINVMDCMLLMSSVTNMVNVSWKYRELYDCSSSET